MHVAYHIGSHGTDDGQLLKSLQSNRDTLAAHGVILPAPSSYRDNLREAIHALAREVPSPHQSNYLLNTMLEGASPQRIVLSYERFICFPKRAFEDQTFLTLVTEKVAGMRQLFPDARISYFMALKNPATFIPDIFREQSDLDYDSFMQGVRPETIAWSHVITRILKADPRAELTVWCDEDTPFIWEDVLRAVSGVARPAPMQGGHERLKRLLQRPGRKEVETVLEQAPDKISPDELPGFIEDLLHDHAQPGVMNQDIDLPGWDQTLVDELTARYDADIARIATMDGVSIILP